jgi:hypothetical protein
MSFAAAFPTAPALPVPAALATGRLSRPRLLAAAARAGAALYRRERDLAGLLPSGATGRGLVAALAAAEAAADSDRRALAPTYSPARHVKLLSALIAEAREAAV